LRACSQASTALGPRLIRRERRPAGAMLVERVLQANLSHEIGKQLQTRIDLLGARDNLSTTQRAAGPVFECRYV